MKSPENVALARELREQGWLLREIAERFGVRTQTIADWIHDPDGASLRARKDSYARPCVDCGVMTSGGQGKGWDEPRCLPCANIKKGAEATIWTRDAILLAIEEWVHEYGEPPAIADWNPTQARLLGDEERARRFEDADGAWPWATNVIRVCGSWNAAIEAAGFTPRARHGGGGNVARRRSQRAKATP